MEDVCGSAAQSEAANGTIVYRPVSIALLWCVKTEINAARKSDLPLNTGGQENRRSTGTRHRVTIPEYSDYSDSV